MGYEGITETEFRKIIPIHEIQKHEGNCWATTLSMLLRCNNFQESQQQVTSLFPEWKKDGITSKQMSELVDFYNKNKTAKAGWEMKTASHYSHLLPYINQMKPIQVFITGHFVLILGEEGGRITYFDPWDGQIRVVSESTFLSYGGGEAVYMYQQ